MVSRARSHTARRAERRALVGLALLALTILAAGCGSDSDGSESASLATQEVGPDGVVDVSDSGAVGEYLGGSVAALVECSDWNGANAEQKLATIEDVRGAEYPGDPGIEGPVMTDEEALELFDGACEPAHAGGFRLYKLYSHAVGFLPLKRALEEE